MEKFTAKNIHSKDSIRRLSAVQYNIFGFAKKLKIFLSGILIVAAANFGNCGALGFGLLMLLGCWLLMSTSLPQMRQSDKLIKMMGGKYPKSSFSFQEDKVIVSTGGDIRSIPYCRFITVAKDNGHYYFFISRMSAYMFPVETVVPQENFERFIKEKTGLKFIKPCSLFQMSLYDMGLRIKNLMLLRKRKEAGGISGLSG